MQPLTIYMLYELTPEFLCRLKDYLSNKFENLGIYTLGERRQHSKNHTMSGF